MLCTVFVYSLLLVETIKIFQVTNGKLYTPKDVTVPIHNYCTVSCDYGGKVQTLKVCQKEWSCEFVDNCIKTNADPRFRKKVVFTLNRIRNEASLGLAGLPKAANMRALSYGRELEYVVKCYLHACRPVPFENLTHCNLTHYYNTMSVLALVTTYYEEKESLTIDTVIEYWAEGQSKIEPADIQKGGKRNAYTQLIWGNAERVGCKQAVDDVKNKLYSVCAFSPRGNEKNQAVYVNGTPCSQCGSDLCNKKETGLCGVDDMFEMDNSGSARARISNFFRFMFSILPTLFIWILLYKI